MSSAARQVGDRIRSARLSRGISQEQLGNELGKRQATISNWEQGHTAPTIEDLLLLAQILECNVNDLLPPPPRAITRAADVQLPLGSRFKGSLDLFLRVATIAPAPERQLEVSATDPIGLAEEILEKTSMHGPPVDVTSVAQGCGARVIGWEAMDDSLAGLLVELGDGPLIAFNSTHPLGRQRFTVAHELGHLLLGHFDTFHVDLSVQQGLNRPGYDRIHEKDANSFAANLLMPARWMEDMGADVDTETAADHFQVSTLAFGYRVQALGLQA